jgi:YfiR/HmsC-like
MGGASVSRRRCISERIVRWTTPLLVLVLLGSPARAQAPADEAQIKAAFVYNFLKFVEWPHDASARVTDPLVVVIVGDGPTAGAVEEFLTTKRVGERAIAIKHLAWDQSLAGVHAAFVSEDDPRRLRRVLEAASSAGVLSIGEGADFASNGGVIALLLVDRRVRFDIDVDAATAARLHVSSKLLALGHVVRSSRGGAVGAQ